MILELWGYASTPKMKRIRLIRGPIDVCLIYGIMCGTDKASGCRKKKQIVKPQNGICT